MTSSFSFTIATPSDVPEMFDFMLSDFLFNQSLNGAIGIVKEDVQDRYLVVTESSVANGTSVVVRNEEGDVIAIRLSGFEDRPKEVSTTPADHSGFPSRAVKIRKILTAINEGKWSLIPDDIDRLFEVKLISVAEKYRGQGIAKACPNHFISHFIALLAFGLDSVRERGATGAFAEAIAIASQVVFKKSGWSVKREILHDEWLDEEGKPVFVCPDGTKRVQLVFKRI